MKAMKVVFVPAKLRLAAALLFLCVPFAAFETVLVTRAPWWRLPFQSIGIWSVAVFLICVPLSAWLLQGKRWALRLTQLFLVAWVLLNLGVAIFLRNPSVGFFTFLLIVCFGSLGFWLEHELGRSFFDPHLKWYQGLPKLIAGLTCRVTCGDQEVNCRVSRLDREGAFVFGDHPMLSLRADLKSELVFNFRDRSLKCEAVPVRAFLDGRGAGFQFQNLVPDLQKNLGDFIELLKGEGYVI
jgi:hypothetical protein